MPPTPQSWHGARGWTPYRPASAPAARKRLSAESKGARLARPMPSEAELRLAYQAGGRGACQRRY